MTLITLRWQDAAVLAVASGGTGLGLRLALARVTGGRRGTLDGGLAGPRGAAVAPTRAATAATGARPRRRWPPVLASALLETSVVLALFTTWQLAGGWALTRVAGAFQRAHWILAAEQHTGLPSELTVQHLVLGHPAVIRLINTFYLYMHVNTMVVFLVWMFWRHRESYRWARNTVVAATAACLLVQMIPVAPPRMLTDAGFIDLALQYGQSIYGPFGSGIADQLSALPSVHVCWALLIAFFVLTASRSRWRWLILAHPAVTVFVVVATANHYWADGIAAGLILAAVLPLTDAIERRRARPGADTGTTPPGVVRRGEAAARV